MLGRACCSGERRRLRNLEEEITRKRSEVILNHEVTSHGIGTEDNIVMQYDADDSLS